MNDKERDERMKKLFEWAKDGRLEAAVDNVIAKLDSGELSIHDLPPMPVKFIEQDEEEA